MQEEAKEGQKKVNPLVERLYSSGIIPEVSIALPTKAYFYREGEVLHDWADPSELHVNPISMLDEAAIQDPLMMLSGEATINAIRKACPAVSEPEKLCQIDAEAILVAARIASKGNTIDVKPKCNHCQKDNDIKVDLYAHLMNFTAYTEEDFNMFHVPFDEIDLEVCFRPTLYEDALSANKALMKTFREDDGEDKKFSISDAFDEDFIMKYKESFNAIVHTNYSMLLNSIFCIKMTEDDNDDVGEKRIVNITDREIISEWLSILRGDIADKVVSKAKEIHDSIRDKSKMDYECEKCNKSNTFYLEMDIQKLFTSAGESSTTKPSPKKSGNTGKSKKTTTKRSRRLS